MRAFAIALLIVVVACALLVILLARVEPQAQPLPPSKYDERIKQLDIEAVESAYKEQIEHLFSVWMKDPTGQPARAVSGARNARKAFIGAMTEIEKH